MKFSSPCGPSSTSKQAESLPLPESPVFPYIQSKAITRKEVKKAHFVTKAQNIDCNLNRRERKEKVFLEKCDSVLPIDVIPYPPKKVDTSIQQDVSISDDSIDYGKDLSLPVRCDYHMDKPESRLGASLNLKNQFQNGLNDKDFDENSSDHKVTCVTENKDKPKSPESELCTDKVSEILEKKYEVPGSCGSPAFQHCEYMPEPPIPLRLSTFTSSWTPKEDYTPSECIKDEPMTPVPIERSLSQESEVFLTPMVCKTPPDIVATLLLSSPSDQLPVFVTKAHESELNHDTSWRNEINITTLDKNSESGKIEPSSSLSKEECKSAVEAEDASTFRPLCEKVACLISPELTDNDNESSQLSSTVVEPVTCEDFSGLKLAEFARHDLSDSTMPPLFANNQKLPQENMPTQITPVPKSPRKSLRRSSSRCKQSFYSPDTRSLQNQNSGDNAAAVSSQPAAVISNTVGTTIASTPENTLCKRFKNEVTPPKSNTLSRSAQRKTPCKSPHNVYSTLANRMINNEAVSPPNDLTVSYKPPKAESSFTKMFSSTTKNSAIPFNFHHEQRLQMTKFVPDMQAKSFIDFHCINRRRIGLKRRGRQNRYVQCNSKERIFSSHSQLSSTLLHRQNRLNVDMSSTNATVLASCEKPVLNASVENAIRNKENLPLHEDKSAKIVLPAASSSIGLASEKKRKHCRDHY